MVSKSVTALTDILRQDQPGDVCWLWPGPVHKRTGYGRFTFDWVTQRAHRIVYELLVGQIPDGFTLDHVCHNEALARGDCLGGVCEHRRCVNPAHLEAVPHLVNLTRGGSYDVFHHHCSQGHLLDRANSYWRGKGGPRYCRTCLNHEPAASVAVGTCPASAVVDPPTVAGRTREGTR
jgi:hypothetical protein